MENKKQIVKNTDDCVDIILSMIAKQKETSMLNSSILDDVYKRLVNMIDEMIDYAERLEDDRVKKEKEIADVKKLLALSEDKNRKYEAVINELQNKEIVK